MKPYYEDELVTLYHGDCREITAWLEADVLVTDPPYGMGFVRGYAVKGWAANSAPIVGDNMPSSRSATRTVTTEDTAVRDEALAAWGADRPALIFGSWRAPRPTGTQMRLIWDKERRSPGGVGVFKHSDEEIYLRAWPNPRGLAGKHGSVIRYPSLRGSDRPDHPTPKPVALMEWLIAECPPGAIAEPFAGSGATLIAAKNLGRRAIGVEFEERYCEIAAKRLAQDTLFGGAA